MKYRRSLPDIGMTSAALKIIAVMTMLIDHFAYAIYRILPGYNIQVYNIMRHIGRVSFPLFAFLIVEGFIHTHNLKKYIVRLFCFAILSEVPYDLAFHDTCFYLGKQNIFFTLLLGLLGIYAISIFAGRYVWNYIKQIVVIIVVSGMAFILRSDYGMHGVLLIIALYYIQLYMRRWISFTGAVVAALLLDEPYAMMFFIPVLFYNGKQGIRLKYLFYFIYPVHLIVFGFVRFMCLNSVVRP